MKLIGIPILGRAPRARRFARFAVVSQLWAFSLLILFGAPAAMAEDPVVCGGYSPTNVARVQGMTWSATVTSLDASGITFHVDHIYANEPAQPPAVDLVDGEEATVSNQTCNPIKGLTVGQQYLWSAHTIYNDGLSTLSTVAWRINGTQLSLVHMYKNELHFPEALAEANTLPAAISLVAPGAELPSTDTVVLDRAHTGSLPLQNVLVGVVAAISAMILFSKRLREERG